MTVPADQATGLGPLAHAARRLSGQSSIVATGGSCIRTWTVGQLRLAVRLAATLLTQSMRVITVLAALATQDLGD